MMYCAWCGAAREASSRFCTQCGRAAETDAASVGPAGDPTTPPARPATPDPALDETRVRPRSDLPPVPPGPTGPPPTAPATPPTPPAPPTQPAPPTPPGTPPAAAEGPAYGWLFDDPDDPRDTGPTSTATRPSLPLAPEPGTSPRRRWGRTAAVAVAVVVLLAGGAAIGAVVSHRHDPAASSVSGRSTEKTTGDVSPTAAPTTSAGARPSKPARKRSHRPTSNVTSAKALAERVRTLLATEAAAHQRDNTAVGAVATCRAIAPGRKEIARFARARAQLLSRLRSLPQSDNPALNGTVRELERIWAGLVPVDDAISHWADHVSRRHRHCRAGTAPSTSQASKDERTAFARRWNRLAHLWHTTPVAALGANGLLL